MKNKLLGRIVFLMVLTFLFSSCKKPSYSINGTVRNVTNIEVVNAMINLYASGSMEIASSTTANELGQYTLIAVKEGNYNLGVTAAGYDETFFSVVVTQDIVQDLTIVGLASVFGTIVDSQTGDGLNGVTVSFSSDNTVTDPMEGDLVITTDYSGDYAISGAPVGTFRMIIEAPGYFTRIIDGITLVSGSNYMDDITSVAPPAEGSLRIVLSWGTSPNDLDSHITGPDGLGDRFHVYFSNRYSNSDEVELDVDDVSSYGPETITINSFYNGMYRYSVHNYSDQTATGCTGIDNSPARVEIYGSTGIIDSFIAPSSNGASGNTWRVFELNVTGSSYQVVSVNGYVYASYSSDMGTFKSIKLETKKVK